MTFVVAGCSTTTASGPPQSTRVFQEILKPVQPAVVPVQPAVVPVQPAVVPVRLFSCKGTGANMFETAGQCNAALLSGECKFYLPTFLSNRNKNPVTGKDTFKVASERTQCVRMRTVNGIKWVAQEKGTLNRHRKDAEGNLISPYARDDCGNVIFAVSAPSTELPHVEKVVAKPTPVAAVAHTPSAPILAPPQPVAVEQQWIPGTIQLGQSPAVVQQWYVQAPVAPAYYAPHDYWYRAPQPRPHHRSGGPSVIFH